MTTEWVQTLPGKYSFPASVERHALALHWRHTFKFNAQAMPCTVRFYTAKEGDGCAARADLVRYALDHVMPPLTKCENGLVADIFLTSCRKVLAPRTLGEDEVNTGYARHGDLWVALAQAMGVDCWRFGDASSGPLSGVLD